MSYESPLRAPTSQDPFVMYVHIPTSHPMHNWIWESFCQPKDKVFLWLLIKNRLSTGNILRRHMDLDSFESVLCQQSIEETAEHLFFRCPFAVDRWNLLNLTVKQQGSLSEILEGFTLQLGPPFFMNPITLMGWRIWTAGNDIIFEGLQPNFQSSWRTFQKEIALLSLRAKERSAHSFESWVSKSVVIALLSLIFFFLFRFLSSLSCNW